jgi:hypothetical protein
MPAEEPTLEPTEEEGVWRLVDGDIRSHDGAPAFREDGVEKLTYSNPYAFEIERVWFEGKVVYAGEQGEVELDFDEDRVATNNKVAQEYQVVYAVDLDDQGKLQGGKEPDRVEGQLNIYDSIPGMENYSPLWQFNYVVVPDDYEANTLRSEADCLGSGYEIRKSTVVEN